ncbi:MAG: hypothetical protein ABIZ64_13390 [Casimicrobium sp.]|jgi:hypothetical protein
MKRLLVSLMLIAASLLGLTACAHQWETVLDGRLYTRTHLHRYPVSIVAVDGEYSTITPRRIDAGVHELVIDAAPTIASYLPDRKVFTFKTEKCVRYWLAAQRKSDYSREYELVIDHAEPVPGCQPTSGAPAQPVIVPSDSSLIEPPRAVPMPKRT